MNIFTDLSKLVENEIELKNCVQNVNCDIEYTFQECYEWCFKPNLTYDATILLKINSVCDFLQDELNTGHWSEVPLCTREAFSGASYIKVCRYNICVLTFVYLIIICRP